MGNHTVSGLLEKKRELLAQQYALQTQLVDVARLITVVNETIALFDPEAATKQLPLLQPRGKGSFKHAELLRAIRDAIKAAPTPPTTWQIVEAIRLIHPSASASLRDSVWEALRRLQKRKVVERVDAAEDGDKTWRIVRPSDWKAGQAAMGTTGTGASSVTSPPALRLV